MLAVLGAMSQEVNGLRKRMSIQESIARDGWQLFRGKCAGKEMLVVRTGIGKDQVESAVKYILSHFEIEGIISVGFGGALIPELQIGDLVLCRSLLCGNGGGGETRYFSDHHLLSAITLTLGTRAVRFILGSSVTVGGLAAEPERKISLRRDYRAEAVDMESYWVARLASEKRLPFLAVRSISDALTQPLPPFDQLIASDGKWTWKTPLYFLSHLSDIARLPRVYINARRAGRSLSLLFDALISEM